MNKKLVTRYLHTLCAFIVCISLCGCNHFSTQNEDQLTTSGHIESSSENVTKIWIGTDSTFASPTEATTSSHQIDTHPATSPIASQTTTTTAHSTAAPPTDTIIENYPQDYNQEIYYETIIGERYFRINKSAQYDLAVNYGIRSVVVYKGLLYLLDGTETTTIVTYYTEDMQETKIIALNQQGNTVFVTSSDGTVFDFGYFAGSILEDSNLQNPQYYDFGLAGDSFSMDMAACYMLSCETGLNTAEILAAVSRLVIYENYQPLGNGYIIDFDYSKEYYYNHIVFIDTFSPKPIEYPLGDMWSAD